jgi:hypothetical protein
MESDIANTDAGTADTRSLTESRDALLPGQITQQAATLASTNAGTNDTTSVMNRRDALLPGEITQQAATLASTNAGTNDTTSVMNRRDALLPGEVSQQGATLSDTIANTESTIAGTTGKGIANRVAEETSDSEIDAAIAGNEANAAESKFKKLENTLAFEDLDREESILTDVMSDDSYNTPEEVQEAYITAIMNDDTIPFERRNQIIASVNKNSLEKLTNESAKLAKGAQTALQKGGMSGLVEYYDTIDDGDTMRIERSDDGTVSIIATRGDEETVLFSDSSQDAETVVTQQMYNQISRPGTGMEVAAAALDMEKTRSETSVNQSKVGLIDKQAFSELLAQDGTKARTALLNAQVDKVRAEIEELGVGLQGAEKINLQGLANLQNSNEFVLLGQQKKGKQIQLSLVADYMRVMKMKDAPPNDVDPQDWFEATDEEKEALRN